MTTFLDRWKGSAGALATFGDSITEAAHLPDPGARWSNRLATLLGARFYNCGRSGTVMQSSPDAAGRPRADNGRHRYRRDLLGEPRADVIAILYGTNDARYTAAPESFSRERFDHDYRDVLGGLLAAGYVPDAIVLGSLPPMPDAGFAVGADDGFAGQSRAEFERYSDTVREIARDTGAFYAPLNERMREEPVDPLYLPDHIHPNEAGHAMIASIFASATRLAA